MTPWQKAEQWHNEHDATRSFAELVGEYLGYGYVWSTPEVFLLAREARWNSTEECFENGEPNTWFVYLAASAGHTNAVGEFLRIAPHAHRYAAWCRRNDSFNVKVYDFAKLLRKTRR